jgi:sugar lactone lactonase YvrE
MRMQSRAGNFFLATAALAVLAACSSTAVSPPSASESEQNYQAAKTGGAVSFISDFNNHAVYVLNAQGALTATLDVDGPEGLAVDSSHNLYVANVAGSDVLVYAPPYNGAPNVLTDPGFRPNGVAVDRNG